MSSRLSHILEIENRLKDAGLKLNAVLLAADVDRSTWTRWKMGKYVPTPEKWQSVEHAVREALRQNARAA